MRARRLADRLGPSFGRVLFPSIAGAGVYSPGMDRIWPWGWDRYAARYSWAMCAMFFLAGLPIYLYLSFLGVAFEKSHHYVAAAAVTVAVVSVVVCVVVLPGLG